MKILLTGAGGPAAIGVARCLFYHDLVGVDSNKWALPFAPMKKKFLVPRADDPTYISALNEIIERERVDFVHAQPDPEVKALALNRDLLGAKTFLPDTQTVCLCQDKMQSYKVWEAKGVPVPVSISLDNEIALDNAWSAFLPHQDKFWVRATTGAAGNGAYVARRGAYEEVRAWVKGHNGWGSFMASEYLPGRLLTWQSIWKDGKLVAGQGRERLEWHMANRSPAGVTGVTGVAKICNRRDIEDIGIMAVRAVDNCPNGIYGVDMKENVDGIPCVTEINIGRFFTTIQFFMEAGTNFPDIYVRAAMGHPSVPLHTLDEDLYWIRSMDAEPRMIRA